jgi:hypothetical protein
VILPDWMEACSNCGQLCNPDDLDDNCFCPDCWELSDPGDPADSGFCPNGSAEKDDD